MIILISYELPAECLQEGWWSFLWDCSKRSPLRASQYQGFSNQFCSLSLEVPQICSSSTISRSAYSCHRICRIPSQGRQSTLRAFSCQATQQGIPRALPSFSTFPWKIASAGITSQIFHHSLCLKLGSFIHPVQLIDHHLKSEPVKKKNFWPLKKNRNQLRLRGAIHRKKVTFLWTLSVPPLAPPPLPPPQGSMES